MIIHYASSGIRKPLHSAFMGIESLHEEMEAEADGEGSSAGDWDRTAKVRAIRDSCSMAMSAVDGLVAYDKLESVADMDAQPVRAWAIIHDTIRMCYAEVSVDVYLELIISVNSIFNFNL